MIFLINLCVAFTQRMADIPAALISYDKIETRAFLIKKVQKLRSTSVSMRKIDAPVTEKEQVRNFDIR